MKKITIHQPDFLPWMGFFTKINKADIWVVLDHTLNNPRDSAFWCRRVSILVNNEHHWLSVPLLKPIEKGLVGIPIRDMKINLSNKLILSRALKTIELNYKRAPYFNEVYPLLESYFLSEESSLIVRNMQFISAVMQKLQIRTEIVYSSTLNCKNSSNELLIEIIKKLGGDIYLCGDGASKYQNNDLFNQNHILIEYNNFTFPYYQQHNSKIFVKGLSIIDCIFNIGYEETKKLL